MPEKSNKRFVRKRWRALLWRTERVTKAPQKVPYAGDGSPASIQSVSLEMNGDIEVRNGTRFR